MEKIFCDLFWRGGARKSKVGKASFVSRKSLSLFSGFFVTNVWSVVSHQLEQRTIPSLGCWVKCHLQALDNSAAHSCAIFDLGANGMQSAFRCNANAQKDLPQRRPKCSKKKPFLILPVSRKGNEKGHHTTTCVHVIRQIRPKENMGMHSIMPSRLLQSKT